MVAEEPKISDSSRYGSLEAARILGISRDTLRRACKTDRIRWNIVSTGKRCYTGKAIKKFWRENI